MKRQWWKEAVVYQVYPRSFFDSNGDGIGDLRGIIAKLDYIKDLGVDVIWLNPVYKSPNDDNGYDISDYCQIMPEFGSMEDFDELLAGVHKHGLKLIMDLVVNHTSDEHPWFVESRSSKTNPKRDFYIWRPARNGKEPNNWGSFFSKSAWELDEQTGEYYLHLFSKKQPDLNWQNPEVRAEVYKIMRWWLDKGIDGFRMDAINLLVKAPGLPDVAPVDRRYVFGGSMYSNNPGMHEILQEMNREVLSKYDIMTVGETCFVTPELGILYTEEERHELNTVFHFEIVEQEADLDLPVLKKIWGKWYEGLKDKGWNSIYLNNHDQPRQVSRFGNDTRYRVEAAKLLGALTHTLPGTPYIYQGEEIGMTNVYFEKLSDYRDIALFNQYREKLEEGYSPEKALALLRPRSRDNARTPMQWDNSSNAGFTAGEPWIRANPNYTEINVNQAQADPDSVLNFYKKLHRIRKENPVLVYGDYECLDPESTVLYPYLRSLNQDRVLVVLNFSPEEQICDLPGGVSTEDSDLLIGNYPFSDGVDKPEIEGRLKLRPWEARIYRLK